MNDERFDDFIQDSVMTIHSEWTTEEIGGRELTSEELQTLNDLLTQFFTDKK